MIKPVFNPKFFRELAKENPLGITLHWREVEAWWNYIAWPSYKTRKYRDHKRALRSWWSRVRMSELIRAHDAVERSRMEVLQELQDQLTSVAEESPKDFSGPLRVILGGKRD